MTLIMASMLERLLQHGNPCDPAQVMYEMNRMIKSTLAQDGDNEDGDGSDDGMDTAFLWFDTAESNLIWASAKTPIFVLTPPNETEENAKIEQINGDRTGVGYRTTSMRHTWNNHTLHIPAGTSVYITTDGIIDQPGGHKRIAFGKKRLKNVLLEQHTLPLHEQGSRIMQAFRAYQGEQTRRDDVTFFGFRP